MEIVVIVRVLATAAFTMAALDCAAEIKPWTGKATPALARPDLSGKVVDLKDFRGRVVLVNFWATWCVPCRDEMPSIMRLRAKLAGKPFEVMTVNYGEAAPGITRYLEKEGISLPVLLDPEKKAASAWGVRGLPMTFLVDAAGRVRHSAFGELDWSEGEPYDFVAKLVEEVARARQ
jgi:thiol-disulfide isomerase/thioredoxin